MSDHPILIDYELDDVVLADTPESLKALGDPVRTLILDLVLERAMTVTELAAEVARSKGTVAHHVDVLVDVGLLKVVRTRKVRALEERFYGRTARTIQFPGPSHGGPSFLRDALAEYEAGDHDDHDDGKVEETTLRHARIPKERAQEFGRRLMDLALEFSAEPRGGDVEYALLISLFPTNRRTRSGS
jgi:DNA-binding transcriptional ArsR family regulator